MVVVRWYGAQLVIVNDNLTSFRYIDELLRSAIVPFKRTKGQGTLFQNDNTHPRRTWITDDNLQ